MLAPNSKHRVLVTPAHRGKGGNKQINLETQEKTTFARKQGMTWAQRLKRVFNIDIEVCDICGKKVKVIACIEDSAVIKKILTHLKVQAPAIKKYTLPEGRSPPQRILFVD